jgi:hypothetical protein
MIRLDLTGAIDSVIERFLIQEYCTIFAGILQSESYAIFNK